MFKSCSDLRPLTTFFYNCANLPNYILFNSTEVMNYIGLLKSKYARFHFQVLEYLFFNNLRSFKINHSYLHTPLQCLFIIIIIVIILLLDDCI